MTPEHRNGIKILKIFFQLLGQLNGYGIEFLCKTLTGSFWKGESTLLLQEYWLF